MAQDEYQVPTGLTTQGLIVRRYFARSLDFLVVGFIWGVIAVIGELLIGDARNEWFELALLISLPPLWLAYTSGLESSSWQATIGKKLLGLRVYDRHGCRISLKTGAGRCVVRDGPFFVFGAITGGEYLNMLWLAAHLIVVHRSAVSQAIHDRVIKTWVAMPEHSIQLRLS